MSKQEPYAPPEEALEALARCLLPSIRSYFESEEGQREFSEWKAAADIEATELYSNAE